MLTLTDVSIRYGAREVVHDVDWEVGGSSLVTALLGPSGCGKSTLLRAIAGLEPVAAGTLAYDGADLARVPVHRRDFGVVFQDGQLFAGRSVGQNVAYGLARRGMGRRAARERVDELLDLVQLPGFADRRVGELSGGQAQRVALARALAPRPRLMLLDEPLAALDRRLRDDLAVAIADIVRASRTPTVVVTHDHGEAALMADVVSVMREGTIVDTAPPQRLWRRPADEWTASFLGASDIVDGEVSGGRLTTGFGDIAIDDGLSDVPAGPCRVALRPDSLRADPDPGSEATVVRAAPLIGSWRLVVDVAGRWVDAIADRPVREGDRVSLTPMPERIGVVRA
ncbi:ABC transporter ATP-binding protein [Gordonia humi]|uniref:ABC-type quaternary amine transporter n=1 Tax=Gordonia humi TaxID=686429 RepID=A0A840F4D5_9ACTN|nr:ABC transporter ATP-binding protein [Gordonia humi]MBB4137308.1 thiamine transport system ATP-binding protein [Gordonia humi]